nr:hypothetical protein [Austwickia chelonae]
MAQVICDTRSTYVRPPGRPEPGTEDDEHHHDEETSTMSKRARKRRDRKKNKANHGRKPNA